MSYQMVYLFPPDERLMLAVSVLIFVALAVSAIFFIVDAIHRFIKDKFKC